MFYNIVMTFRGYGYIFCIAACMVLCRVRDEKGIPHGRIAKTVG